MAAKTIIAVFLTAVAAWAALIAESAAPAPAVDCGSLVLNMADCLTFVSNGTSVSKPEGTCCSGLKTVLKTDAQCLCEAFRNSAQLGVTLNVTKALTLPAACHVSSPPLSDCGLSISTGASPALPPSGAALPPGTSISPSGVLTPVAGANDVAPAQAPGTTGSSSSLAIPVVGSLVLAMAVASFSSLCY